MIKDKPRVPEEMMKVIKGRPATVDDLLDLINRPGVEGYELKDLLTKENSKVIEEWEHSYSLVDVAGKVWAWVGFMPLSDHRYEAFMDIDPGAGKYMLPITKLVKYYMEHVGLPVIESNVRRDFEPGHRFNRMIGFKDAHVSDAGEFIKYILVRV